MGVVSTMMSWLAVLRQSSPSLRSPAAAIGGGVAAWSAPPTRCPPHTLRPETPSPAPGRSTTLAR